jgi:inorganic pyrophosphatase
MRKNRIVLILILLSLSSCQEFKVPNEAKKTVSKQLNSLIDIIPINENGLLNAIVEIPAGTLDKWELNKFNGQIEWEFSGGKERRIRYLGYPGNYGFVPQTLLPKAGGGDGDPLDILIIGPPAERGSIVQCKILGVLFLDDNGERDDKIIAVSDKSLLYEYKNIGSLHRKHQGILQIIELWFVNYKGFNKMKSNGYGSSDVAEDMIDEAINEFMKKKKQSNNLN